MVLRASAALIAAVAALAIAAVGQPPTGCPQPAAPAGGDAPTAPGLPAAADPGAPTSTGATAAQPPAPVGWDTFRRLDLLPLLAPAEDALLFSSSDPSGGNADGFRGGSSYLCRDRDGFVLAQHSGPGEITSLWFTRDSGDVRRTGRVRIELDGQAVVDAPLHRLVDGALGPPFVPPLVANAEQASGGVYVQVPMPFRRSMRVVTEFNPRFYRIGVRALADPAGIAPFDPSDPAADVVDLLRAAGTRDPKPAQPGTTRTGGAFRLSPGEQVRLVALDGPGVVTALRLRLAQAGPAGRRPDADLRLRIRFDGRRTVDAPVREFFGAGLGGGRVAALLFAVDPDGWSEAWWPMPFARSATISLHSPEGTPATSGEVEVRWRRDGAWSAALGPGGSAGHFHATSHAGQPEAGRDWVFADLDGSGRILGVSHTMTGLAPGRTYLEGDERVHVDGSPTAQVHGTGTEDFYLAGWYFNRGPFTTPFTGHTAHLSGTAGCPHRCDAAYRVLLPDAVPFRTGVLFTIEHGVRNRFPVAYSSTTFWYGRPEPGAVRTDVLDVGDVASEAAHAYRSHRPGRVGMLRSRFDGALAGEVVRDRLRGTTASVSFTLSVDPDNAGVRLRRRFDQRGGYQAALVAVDGTPAGVWLHPRGNAHHRWADDALLLPATLTAGRSRLDITLEPLDPSRPWSAARYEAWSLRRGR